MERHVIRNLLNSLSHERSQTDNRLRKHPSSALTDSGGVDQGSLDLGSDSSVAAASVQGPLQINNGGDGTVSTGLNAPPGPGTYSTSTVTVGSGSGIIFNDTFDSSCSQAYINCVIAAENAIRSQWTNSITLNLDFNEKAEGTGADADLATNLASSSINVTYAQLKQALQAADAASPDLHAETAARFLPEFSPAGSTDFSITEAYARMLGLSSATPAVDATVTLNSSWNWSFGQDAINAIEHEISEGAMGRIGGLGDQGGAWDTMDLFRYDASGVPDTTDGRDGNKTYFSFNGGSTLSTLSFNNEFAASGARSNTNDTADFVQEDVFGTGLPGETFTYSATDLDIMDVLGWIPSSPHTPPTLLTTNHTVWEKTPITGVFLQDGITDTSGDSITQYAFRDLGTNGQFTVGDDLNGTPVPDGQWAIVDADSLANVVYHAGATPGTDTIQASVNDATLATWLPDTTFSMTTNVEPVVTLKSFAAQEGASVSIAPLVGVSNPSRDGITEYGFEDLGTNGHFTVDYGVAVAEPNAHWFYVPAWDLAAVQYVGGSTTGSDQVQVVAFDDSVQTQLGDFGNWTAVGQATATTTLPRILPPPGDPISPVNALAVTAETSGTAGAAPPTSTATDTLFGNSADTLVAGSPNATLVGGPGSDMFVVGPGGGQETIQNFDPQHDTLQFGSLFANYAAAMTDARQVCTGTVFTLDAHDSVTLQNVNIGSLAASNFHFS